MISLIEKQLYSTDPGTVPTESLEELQQLDLGGVLP